MNFTDKDLAQIKKKGLTPDKVEQQMAIFKNGLPFSNLVAAATIENGITGLDDKKNRTYTSLFENKKNDISIIKFVPASGAATRMFKFLFAFLDDYDPDKESVNAYINKHKDDNLSMFFVGVEKFPFYDIVMDKLHELYPDFDERPTNQQRLLFVKTMLHKDQLDYGNYPKGLLPFHEYKNQVVSTAFEEHLFETALYAPDNKPTELHFTVSEKHKDKFDKEFKRIEEKVEHNTGSKFDISFSYQKQSTDTLAVTPNDEPFRLKDGSILFRPSGHGALLENLNDLKADVIFIKNIDNVVVYKYKDEVAKYKKILAGLLLEVQAKSFHYLRDLESGDIPETHLIQIADFLVNDMNVKISPEFEKYSKKYRIEYLIEKLNRPIRVCGMVKNEGEPGGGPFWVKDDNGNISLQIVESAQIDLDNKRQERILKDSTHFNPVDIVCGVKNYKNEKFDLTKYVDDQAAFITNKTKAGETLKALELPGLWNGSMANWNTIFVEVPLITFNPVKTVNDLLKSTHQLK